MRQLFDTMRQLAERYGLAVLFVDEVLAGGRFLDLMDSLLDAAAECGPTLDHVTSEVGFRAGWHDRRRERARQTSRQKRR